MNGRRCLAPQGLLYLEQIWYTYFEPGILERIFRSVLRQRSLSIEVQIERNWHLTLMPLFYLSLAFLAGVLLAPVLTFPATIWFGIAAVGLVAGFALHRLQKRTPTHTLIVRLRAVAPPLFHPDTPLFALIPVFPFLLAAALALGAGRYQSSRQDLSNPAHIAVHTNSGEAVVITGVLIQPPDERDRYTNLVIQAERIRPTDSVLHTPIHGKLLARTEPVSAFQYGDRLVLTGFLEVPPEDEGFSYRAYLARQGIYAYMTRANAALLESDQGNPLLAVIFALRERAFQTIHQLYPNPEASLLAGILLGIETGIPESLQTAYRDTGTAHIIAISGFNITLLTAVFLAVAGRVFGMRLGSLIALIAIALYTLFVGADAAVVRAAIMGALAIFALRTRRQGAGLNSLAVAAALMTFANPLIPWDVGFQLSFTATLGLILYSDPIVEKFTQFATRFLPSDIAQKVAGPVGEFFLLTFAAQITTLPLLLFYFQRISLIAFLANPLILPAQPPLMTLGGLSVILGLVLTPVGKMIAPFAWVFTAYTNRVVEYMGKIPGGSLVLGETALPVIVLTYALIFGVTYGWQGRGWTLPKLARPATLAAVSLLAVLAWRSALTAPDGRLHLTLLDVGDGDAVLIRSPTGRHMLIDGGPSVNLLSEGIGRRLPLWDRRIDYLVIAAPFENQIAALPRILESYPPTYVLWSGETNTSRSARLLRDALAQAQIRTITPEPNHTLDLGSGASLRVLTLGKRGAILLLNYLDFRALLPIGADFDDLYSLQNGGAVGPVSVLLLAESGLAALNPPQWLAATRPQIVLLSVAAGNPKGLPSTETLETLKNYTLLRTDHNGWIHLTTDGETMWVEVERK